MKSKSLDFAKYCNSVPETSAKLLKTATGVQHKKKKNTNSLTLTENNVNLKNNKTNEDSHKNKHKDSENLIANAKKNRPGYSKPIENANTGSDHLKENENKNIHAETLLIHKKGNKNKDQSNKTAYVNNTDDSTNFPTLERKSKPKKRNKSGNFITNENVDVVAVKKTKSDVECNDEESTGKTLVKPAKQKRKTKLKVEADNEPKEIEKKENTPTTVMETNADIENDKAAMKKKWRRKLKKQVRSNELVTDGRNKDVDTKVENSADQMIENKPVRSKKKKHRSMEDINATDEGPVLKSHKKDVKTEVITDLENLNIGDNSHKLTSLIDGMTVVDRKKKKRSKSKQKQDKRPNVDSAGTELGMKMEREKWKNKKWNKDKKGEVERDKGLTPVLVENLPIKIMVNYKKLLTEHFSKCGVVRRVGIAEIYPDEDPKPVFTTTVYFESEDDGNKALEEDNTKFEGEVIRVKRSLPAADTTAVVQSYGELNDQVVSSVFCGAGRIRRIRHLVKRKKSKATAFVEFDGPETVERAIKIAEGTRVGGKNIYVSKYQMKPKTH